MRFLLPLLLLATAAAPAPQFNLPQLKADVETLSSDPFEGRAPGTEGEKKTLAYLTKRMAEIGLKPGNKGEWLQPVPMVAITTDPSAVITVTGGKAPVTLAMNKDVAVATRRPQARVAVDGSELVFAGHGIVAPERGWNDYAGLDVRGKTVLVLVNDPDWQTAKAGKDAGLFSGREMTYYGRYTYKFEEALRQGAAAVLVIHADEPAGYPFGVVGSGVGRPVIGLDGGDGKALDYEGWITTEAATRVLAAAGMDLGVLTKAAQQKGFKPVATGLKASTVLDNKVVRSASYNVVGMLPGAKRPDEVVLYTAHWDHTGRCKADASGDDICNGAIDNASGTAGLLAIADAFAKAKRTARSVAFIAVTAEESGLLGSQYYAEHPVFPLGKTVGGVNMDGLNTDGVTEGITISGAGKSELEAMAAKVAAAQGRKLVPEASPEKGYYFRSDHFSLAKLGVPMLSAGSGGELVGKPPGSAEVAAADYVKNRYHQPGDEYDPNWNWSGALQDLALYADIGRSLANSTAWPNWLPSSEFRSIRDESRAGASK